MDRPNPEDRAYFTGEVAILRDKISEYVNIIIQTERLCIGASGFVAAFVITEMADAATGSRVAVGLIPLLIMVLGFLRCATFATIVIDITKYIEAAEAAVIAHDRIGFQKTSAATAEERSARIGGSTSLFWLLCIGCTLAFVILIAMGAI